MLSVTVYEFVPCVFFNFKAFQGNCSRVTEIFYSQNIQKKTSCDVYITSFLFENK